MKKGMKQTGEDVLELAARAVYKMLSTNKFVFVQLKEVNMEFD